METLTRHDEKGKAGTRIIHVDKCWECPYAESKRLFGFGYYVTCKLTDKEYRFDDNGCYFSTPYDCPLTLLEDEQNSNE